MSCEVEEGGELGKRNNRTRAERARLGENDVEIRLRTWKSGRNVLRQCVQDVKRGDSGWQTRFAVEGTCGEWKTGPPRTNAKLASVRRICGRE